MTFYIPFEANDRKKSGVSDPDPIRKNPDQDPDPCKKRPKTWVRVENKNVIPVSYLALLTLSFLVKLLQNLIKTII